MSSPLATLTSSNYGGILLLLSVLLLAICVSRDLINLAPRRVKLPGPAGFPLVGNLFHMRAGHARSLAHWTKLYGGMFRLALGEREAVIINTYADVNKTLIQQGAAFQSRPEFKLWHGAFSRALDPDAPTTIGTTKFSEQISKYRRLLTAQTSAVKLPRFVQTFGTETPYILPQLVNLLAESSKSGVAQDLGFHFWTTTIGISADILFGQRFDEDTTRLVADVNIKAFRQRSLATPVHDYVPFVATGERILLAAASPVRSILRALGCASWLDSIYEAEAHAAELRDAEVAYCKDLLRDLHERLDAGDPTPSQMGDIFRTIDDGTLTPNEELRLATTLTGSGMSSGTGLTWLAAHLAAHPELQEKAYRAIEDVYGGEPPDPLDTDRVEYIKALGTEAGRYFASIRLGFPRETHEDVVVDGVLIPKGVLVVYNSYQINRDPQRYDFPEEFVPERWMEGHYGRTDVKQPKVGVPHLNHGAGRRVCMGVPNVNKMFYGNLVLLLHFFKLERAPLGDAARAAVFPNLRAVGEASLEVHPIDDQVSASDPQALPLAAGIKLTARDPQALARWLAEGHLELDQWDRPNPTDASLPSDIVDPGIRGHY
ncbi:putative cytochrome P450 phenylacetate 2-hydroxylase [Mycena albidolilacea]|uniref:Cytochrome P450 phenylacetate 2-hydroxylase n=1 Tax=Mycena albidolilacea TaxID=1033008 RepID=A0AAD7AIU2_9AGAR|nr:putative cytochrome P450 phenylacetate 2-hydroxylase [Mycena albidolilacea]